MSLKGGYKVIDFKAMPLSGNATTIPGIYEAIEGNFHKRLIASGIVVDSKELNDTEIIPKVSGDDFIIDVYEGEYTLTINDDDEVTVAVNGAKFVEAPESADSDGIKGQIAFDESYIYVCVDADTWKRAELSTWE